MNALQRRTYTVRDAASAATQELDGLRSERTDLERKGARSYGPDDAYAPLVERCVETKVDKYTYRVCPFSEAEQAEDARDTSLGSWTGFDEAGEHMLFEGGEQCWGGPQRSMTVRVKCGAEETLSRVAEPSRCEYSAEMTTPAACSEAQVAVLRSSLAAKQARMEGGTAAAAAAKDEL